MTFWTAQILGLTGSLLAFTAVQTGSRRKIIGLQLVCCVLWVVQYVLLGAWTGVLINLLGLARGVVCAYNDRPWARSRLWLALFLACYGAAPLLTWDGPYCLLLGAAMMLTTAALWTRNMRLTRLLFLLNSPPVFAYNLIAGSYTGAAIEVAAFCSFALAVWRFDLRRPAAGSLRNPYFIKYILQEVITMNLNPYLDVAPEVAAAVAAGKPVVALESTIISHGMPYPQNVETALKVEQIIRDNGAVPATIAILGGRLKAGLTAEEIEYLGKKGQDVTKASRRDLAVLVSRKADGATTVTTTMMIAHMAGIQVFATGGIGGVHRGAETTMDISADLEELASTPVMVVCAGAKSILDLGLTLEYLETHGVPVLGYGTKELPAFYTRKSGFEVDYRVDTPAELAAAFRASLDLGLRGGMLVTNPIPEEFAMDHEVINRAIDEAVAQANAQGIHGKATTPFLLAKVKELTGGDSLDSNIQLVFNNARLAAQTAAELCRLG